MTDDVRNIVLGVVAASVSAALGWLARTYLWKRKLRRKQAFFGLPDHSESLLVVNREAGGPELTVMRHDVFALLELAALIKDCNAHAQVVAHDATQQGFGERTEFCVGGPASNDRGSGLLPRIRGHRAHQRCPRRQHNRIHPYPLSQGLQATTVRIQSYPKCAYTSFRSQALPGNSARLARPVTRGSARRPADV